MKRTARGLLLIGSMSTKNRVFSCSGLVLVAALSATGCYARAGARVEPAYVETTYVPARVDVYPNYYYEGRTVYLIDGHWYYRHPTGRWVYYREEPPVLYRQRMAIRQAPTRAAPPARPTTPVRLRLARRRPRPTATTAGASRRRPRLRPSGVTTTAIIATTTIAIATGTATTTATATSVTATITIATTTTGIGTKCARSCHSRHSRSASLAELLFRG